MKGMEEADIVAEDMAVVTLAAVTEAAGKITLSFYISMSISLSFYISLSLSFIISISLSFYFSLSHTAAGGYGGGHSGGGYGGGG